MRISYTSLFYDEDGVVELLALKKRMEEMKKNIQLGIPVPVRNHDGKFAIRSALNRLITPAKL
jgi:hypothetical protein